MQRSRKLLALAASAIALPLATSAHAQTLGNANFETPDMGNAGGAYSYGAAGPTNGFDLSPAGQGGTGFTFGPGSGLAAEGSDFGVGGVGGGAGTPDGDQVAFIQGTGSFSQAVGGLVGGEIVTVNFLAASRPNAGPSPLQVSLGGTLLTFSGSQTINPGGSFITYTSDPVTVAGAGSTLTFTGLGQGTADVSSFIDAVSVTIPEPATLSLLGLGGLALLARRRRA